jgi:hypothetical protein
MAKEDIVQIRNPETGTFVKVNKATGNIVSWKKSEGPYKDIPETTVRSIKKPLTAKPQSDKLPSDKPQSDRLPDAEPTNGSAVNDDKPDV